MQALKIEVLPKKDFNSEYQHLPYIDWYFTSNKSSYNPIIFPYMGEEKIIQVETKLNEGTDYHVLLELKKRKKLESLRNCTEDQVPIECASKR